MINKDKIVIIGAGHNGLIAACYLARAGREVIVLEASDKPGGGSRTEERLPGYHFDMHSVAHNIINMTNIPAELELAKAGLEYIEMNPFSVAIRADGQRVRFYRSIEQTVHSIAAIDPKEAQAYAEFMEFATPLIRLLMPAIKGETGLLTYPRRLPDLLKVLRKGSGPLGVVREILSPYESVLKRWLTSDLTRGPISAFAAHGSSGPHLPGAGIFVFWQAAFHLYGQWHARGGSVALIDALGRRLESYGGSVRCNAPVGAIEASGGQVKAVILEDGERIETSNVISAIQPQQALLKLLNPPLDGKPGRELAAARTSNAVQALVHVALDRLPPYPNARPEDYYGLQSFVDTLDEVKQGFLQAEAGYLPDPLPLYAFTTSALDDRLAPPGHHTLYLACPCAPSRFKKGTWADYQAEFIEKCFATMENRAPGFKKTIQGVKTFTPDEMEAYTRWPLAHPMHLDLALDQLGLMRPTPGLANHRTPVKGLYICGAGTSPVGGIAGTSGRIVAKLLLKDK